MSLTAQFIALSRARTQQDRIRALRNASYDKRFNVDQQSELKTLLEEAGRAPDPRFTALRPILNPAEICNSLVPLKGGPKPVLTPKQESVVAEWIEGWRESVRLQEAKITAPGPLLLCGPTGGGKTMLAGYVAAQLAEIRRAVVIEAHKMISSHLGQSSVNLDAAFQAANLNSGLVVIEEIDALAETRIDTGSGADRENNRITVSLMRLIEGASAAVIATTNRADILDAALLRRFEYRVDLAMPDEALRREVLGAHFQGKAPEALVGLPLTVSIPLVARIKRLVVLRGVPVDQAVSTVLAT